MKKYLLALTVLLFSYAKAADLSLKITSGFDVPEVRLVEKVLQEGFKRADVELVFEALPNQRSLLNANKGISDGEGARIEKIKSFYPNLVHIPVSTHSLELVALSRKKIDLKDFGGLEKYNVGVVRGMKIAEKKVQAVKPRSYTAAINNEKLIRMLQNNRIDIIVTNKIALLTNLKELNITNLYMQEKPLLELPLYMQLHKKHQALIPKFTKAFKSMIEDGTYERIRKEFMQNIRASKE